MRYFSLVSALLLLVGLLSACKQEKVDSQPDPGLTWQPHPDFLFDRKIQLTSYADSNIAILSGIRTTAIAPNPDGKPSAMDTTFAHFGGQAENNGRADYRPLLHPNFFGFLSDGLVRVVSTRDPTTQTPNGTTDRVMLNRLDPDFASFSTQPVWGGETMAANNLDQFIVPYTVYDRNYNTPVPAQELRLMLVSLNVSKQPFGGVKVARTLKIILPDSDNMRFSLHSIGTNFIVSSGLGTYRIKPDGSVAKTYPSSIVRQFTFNKITYGISWANTGNLQLVASTDQGESWSTIAPNIPNDYWLLNYKQVGNQLIASYISRLYQLTITPNTLTATELDNTGLEGNQITSVAQFRNTVYISTLSGLFTKPVRTFLAPKRDK